MSGEIGRVNEAIIEERYRNLGYQVLNMNKRGFPDLIVLEGKEVKFFVEVKGGKHRVHTFQWKLHKELEKMGFPVKIERIE